MFKSLREHESHGLHERQRAAKIKAPLDDRGEVIIALKDFAPIWDH